MIYTELATARLQKESRLRLQKELRHLHILQIYPVSLTVCELDSSLNCQLASTLAGSVSAFEWRRITAALALTIPSSPSIKRWTADDALGRDSGGTGGRNGLKSAGLAAVVRGV